MSIPLQGVQDEATSGATSASPKFLPSTLAVIGTLGDHSMAHVAHALSVMGMSARDIDPVLRPLASFKKTGEDEAMAELRYSSWLRLVKSNVAALKAYLETEDPPVHADDDDHPENVAARLQHVADYKREPDAEAVAKTYPSPRRPSSKQLRAR